VGTQPGQLSPADQKDIPYHNGVILSNKTRGEVGEWAAARGLAGHQSVGGEQLFSFALLVFLGFYFSLC